MKSVLVERQLTVMKVSNSDFLLSYSKIINKDGNLTYQIFEPILNSKEKEMLLDALPYVRSRIPKSFLKKRLEEIYYRLVDLANQILRKKGKSISGSSEVKLGYYLYRDLIGMGSVESIYHDPDVLFISCEGLGYPVKVYHSKYGTLETNVTFVSQYKIGSMIGRILEKCKSRDAEDLKGILHDGSFFTTNYEFAFDIRKAKVTFDSSFLIKNKMISPGALAYLWSLVKHKSTVMIIGSKNSGKTTFLSGLLHLLPNHYIVSIIEEEPKIQIKNLNWNPIILSSLGFKNISSIIKNELRRGPNLFVIDEVKYEDAPFVFKNLEHTQHIISIEAEDTDDVMYKLTAPPFNLPKQFITNVDVIVMLNEKRQVEEILEILKYEPSTNEIHAKIAFKRMKTGELAPLESRFMRSLEKPVKKEMLIKAKELHSLSKK